MVQGVLVQFLPRAIYGGCSTVHTCSEGSTGVGRFWSMWININLALGLENGTHGEGERRGASTYMGVSKNGGTPKWMVYDGKPY